MKETVKKLSYSPTPWEMVEKVNEIIDYLQPVPPTDTKNKWYRKYKVIKDWQYKVWEIIELAYDEVYSADYLQPIDTVEGEDTNWHDRKYDAWQEFYTNNPWWKMDMFMFRDLIEKYIPKPTQSTLDEVVEKIESIMDYKYDWKWEEEWIGGVVLKSTYTNYNLKQIISPYIQDKQGFNQDNIVISSDEQDWVKVTVVWYKEDWVLHIIYTHEDKQEQLIPLNIPFLLVSIDQAYDNTKTKFGFMWYVQDILSKYWQYTKQEEVSVAEAMYQANHKVREIMGNSRKEPYELIIPPPPTPTVQTITSNVEEIGLPKILEQIDKVMKLMHQNWRLEVWTELWLIPSENKQKLKEVKDTIEECYQWLKQLLEEAHIPQQKKRSKEMIEKYLASNNLARWGIEHHTINNFIDNNDLGCIS